MGVPVTDMAVNVPWGTHFCLFYKGHEDLIEALIPYIEAGLRNNEFCMCITSEPLNTDDVKARMAQAIPGFDDYIERMQIEFISYTDWYKTDGKFNRDRVLNGWIEKKRNACERGFTGLRLTGNVSWLDKNEWKDFLEYEETINEIIGLHNIKALCTYSLETCNANDILDVVSTHQFAVTRHNDRWKVIQDQGQKQAREELNESKERLRLAQESAKVGIWDWNPVTGENNWTPELEAIYGLAPGTIKTYDDWRRRIFPDDIEKVTYERDEALARHETFDIEFRIIHSSGEVRWVNAKGGGIYNEKGDVIRVLGVNIDITRRKRVEESFRLTQFAMDNFSDSAIWLDMDGKIIYVNETACRSVGYTRDELLSMHIWDIDPYYPQDTFKKKWQDADPKSGFSKFESQHVARDGRSFPVEITACIIKYGDKQYIITFDRDITERRQIENDLKEARAQTELYLDLMGHDINNMHQVMLGYLEMARDIEAYEGPKEFIDKPIEVLQRSSLLIKNVRKLQKLHEGILQKSIVDLHTLLKDVQREYGGTVADKTISLSLNGCKHCHVQANELLHDVFANLVSNAIKHTGDRADIAINLEMLLDDGKRYCRVSVEDNGPGIHDKFKDVIFNRMLKGTLKTKGMGLGLYLVKSLVESYNGKVWAEDRVKGDHTKGARFVVTLPMAE